jgi:replicative DNA helicase
LEYDNAILKKINANINKTFTLEDLDNENIEPIKWAVDGLIPEGLTLLCGNPKTGKSFMALDLAISIIDGKKIFDQIPVEQGAVLYLALEDGKRRLKERSKIVGGNIINKKCCHFSTNWQTIDKGGWGKLIQKIGEIENLKLVIIDTLAKIRPDNGKKESYQEDYKVIGNLKRIADELHVPMMLLHHLRKTDAENPLDKILGSNAVTGATDTILILDRKRESDLASLRVIGRDIEEKKYSMKFEKQNCTWKFTDEVADQPQQDKMSDMIVELINNNGGTMKAKDISSYLTKKGCNEQTIRWWLSELVKKKILSRDGRGVYQTNQQTNNIYNNILNKTTTTNTLNNVCLLDSSSTTITNISEEANEDESCLNVCLLDPFTNNQRSIESDEDQDTEPVTDCEINLDDTDIIEDVSNLLTPDICRKDCIHYDPVKPSYTNGNKELKEFCYASVSGSKISTGNVCNNYKNKNEKDALEAEGCLNF